MAASTRATRRTSSSSTAGGPFVEEDVDEFARHVRSADLSGSDWPRTASFARPRDFFANVANFSVEDQRRIMYENARELTFSQTATSVTCTSDHS
jgi:hypothetical protein